MFWIDRLLFLLGFALVSRRELFLRQRDSSQYSSVDLYAAIEIMLVGAALTLIMLNGRLLALASEIRRCSLYWVFLFLVCAIGLAFLSTNVFYSLFFAGEFISQILLVFVIVAGSKNQKSLIRRVLYCCVIVTVLSISFKFFRNGFGGELFAYKSNGGAACACIGAVFSFSILWSHSQGNRRLGYITFLICLLGIVLTTSAASIVSAFFGIALASLVLGKGRSLLLVFVLISAGFFAFNPDLAFATMFPGKDIEQVTSLHGRTNFWQSAYELFQVRPFFGYGYAMAAKIGHLSGTNLHNSIFSVLLGTGFVGVGIFIVGLIHVTNEAIRLIVIRFPVAGAAFAAFAAGLLNSNSISFFGEDWRGASFLFFMMWAIIGFLAIKSRELQLNRFKK